MVSIIYSGRLGNNLFQYVAAYIFAKKFKLKTTLKKKRSSFHDKYIPSIQKAKTELKLRLKYDSLISINRVIYSIKKNTYL